MTTYGNYDQDTVVSVGTWVLISIALAIPLINLLVMLYLAFGSENQNLKNYGKAGLIMIVIAVVFSLLFVSCNAV